MVRDAPWVPALSFIPQLALSVIRLLGSPSVYVVWFFNLEVGIGKEV